jgi:RNA polymerase sigma factor (sigma-70 family)
VDDSDDALMLRAGRGDRPACGVLVERHLGRTVSFAYRMLGSRSEAEDAAQEAFLRVWSAAPRWRTGQARFTTWLHRIVMNVCLDRIARRRETTGDVPEIVDPRPEPSHALQASEVARHVGTALASLPEMQRAAVTLCHYQGMRNREAAEVMGVSVEALESLLVRGRRALRAALAGIAPALLGTE